MYPGSYSLIVRVVVISGFFARASGKIIHIPSSVRSSFSSVILIQTSSHSKNLDLLIILTRIV